MVLNWYNWVRMSHDIKWLPELVKHYILKSIHCSLGYEADSLSVDSGYEYLTFYWHTFCNFCFVF